MSSWIEYTPPVWRDLQMRNLKVDQAYLVPKSERKAYIYSLSEECYTCPYTKVKVISPDEIVEPLKFAVDHSLSFKVFDHDVGRYAPENITSTCTLQPSMQEFGVYNFSIYLNGSCEIITDKPGVNVNLSILSVLLICLLLYAVTKLSQFGYKKYRSWSSTEIVISTAGPEQAAAKPPEKRRMRSLDAFRGLVIVLMIFVNTGGGGYWWIEHAPWNGLHLADVVFPSFLWIMGVCIPISIKSQLARGATKKSIRNKIIWRSIKMFLIGVCLNSINGPQLSDLRIMGVLQRFGVAFLVVGLAHTTFAKQEYIMPQSGIRRSICDLILLKEQIVVVIGLIAISLGITYGVDAPGCPRGYVGPGGKHSYAAHPDCIGGISGYLDRVILGESHIYQHPTAKYIYDSRAFDPEGLFGCILTVVQVFFGVICGAILITHTEVLGRVKRWSVWAIALGLLGGMLCLFSTESGWIPLNKNLWSLSFVLVTSSIAFALLSIMYYVIDVTQLWTGYPFAECGMNAIILYVGHTVFHKMLPWHWAIGAMNTHFMLLLKSLWTTFLWIVVAVYLDGIKFYYSL